MLISLAVMAMIIIRHDAAAIVMDLGGMIDQPNSHPQKEEYFHSSTSCTRAPAWHAARPGIAPSPPQTSRP
jgi:hypothetical protein